MNQPKKSKAGTIVAILVFIAAAGGGTAAYRAHPSIIPPTKVEQTSPAPSPTPAPVEEIHTTTPAPYPANHVGPDNLYPNPTLTPGKADTLNAADLQKTYNGLTYSKSHRNVPVSEKQQVYQEYGVSFPQPQGSEEVDHFYPVCAGGSNEIVNLWLQPAKNDWNGKDFGFHAKDLLESTICQKIKAGQMDPAEAFKRMTSDWVKFYLDLGLQYNAPTLGAAVE